MDRTQLLSQRAQSIVASFKKLFQEDYTTPPETIAVAARRPFQPASVFMDQDYFEEEPPPVMDEINAYLTLPRLQDVDALVWWKDHKAQFPRLSKMAFDFLTIPVMSSECERVFSQAKLILSTQRQSLSSDTINKLQCLKNWRRN